MVNMKISEQEIIKAQELWAENIIKIGKLYLESGKYKMLINADMTIKDKTNPINFEAIVDPANSLAFFSLAAKDNLHFPISRSRTSKKFSSSVSKRTSFPTIPISTAP